MSFTKELERVFRIAKDNGHSSLTIEDVTFWFNKVFTFRIPKTDLEIGEKLSKLIQISNTIIRVGQNKYQLERRK